MTKDILKIKFIKSYKETSDIYSFVFQPPENYSWEAGQHAIFKFIDEKINDDKDFRIFSFASIEKEKEILVSTRITKEHSDFKEHLLNLSKGDQMEISEPLGKFLLPEFKNPTCFIIGGIGITPIRGFVKSIILDNLSISETELLYADDRNEFSYKELFTNISEKRNNFSTKFIDDRDKFNQKINNFVSRHNNQGKYYISGTPGMVKYMKGKLEDLNISKENIKTDTFSGY